MDIYGYLQIPVFLDTFEFMKKIICSLVALAACVTLSAQEYGVVNLSVCNLRATPDYDAEMVSQALLGTPVHILQVSGKNGWPEIQSPDTYTGWVHREGITPMSREAYSAWNASPKVVVTGLSGVVLAKPSRKADTVSDVVAGDRLRYLGRKGRYLHFGFPDGREGYIHRSIAMTEERWRAGLDQSPAAILATALSMNGFPYLWAGMSPKGMDCSGFVRTVLYLHDIIIPRDASQQAPMGERITDPEVLQPGDLLFFGNRETGRVSHVGFYLGDRRFIHSLGRVKVASMDPSAPDYDAYNTGRYLFAGRVLPYVDREEGLNTTLTNPYYNE